MPFPSFVKRNGFLNVSNVSIPILFRKEWFFLFLAHSHPLSVRIPVYRREWFSVFSAFPSFVRPHSGISAGMVFLFSAHSRPLGRPESGLSALGRGLPALSRHPAALSRHPGRDKHILFFVNAIRRKEHRRILQRTQYTKFRHRLLRKTEAFAKPMPSVYQILKGKKTKKL